MLLSPEAVQVLNDYCVVYTVNVLPGPVSEQRRVQELAKWAQREAPQLAPILQGRVDIGPFLLSPEGAVLTSVQRPEGVIPEIQDAAAKCGVKPGPPVSHAQLGWFDDWRPGHLPLKLTTRFVRSDDSRLPKPPPWQAPMMDTIGTDQANRDMYEKRLGSPTREGIPLPPDQAAALLPPDPEAREWEVPHDAALELLWLFRPSTHQYRVSRSDVHEVSLRATRDGEGRALLQGRVRMKQWWYPRSAEGLWLGDRLAEDYWAEAPVRGYLEFAGRKVREVKLVSDGAVYRGLDGTWLPYEAAMWTVDEAEAAASCSLNGRAIGTAGAPSAPPR